MATVYEAEITLSVAWCSYKAETIKKVIKDALEGLKVEDSTNRLENVDVIVERTN